MLRERLPSTPRSASIHGMTYAGHIVSAIVALSSWAATAAPEPDQLVTYKEVEGDDLKLHIFKPEGWSAGDARPAIVFFFGGGWTGGHPRQFYPHCEHLADKGLLAVSAEYRTRKSHGTDPFKCVEDGKSAIRYLRSNATKLGIDPAKIVAAGGSAGGHVAACTGTIDGFEVGDTEVSSKPRAMVLFNPVCDTSARGYGNKKIGERWREISPRHNASKAAPPTCVFHGDADTTVPIENAKGFKANLEKAGVRCELHVYPGAAHGFFNFGRGDGSAYTDTVAKMDQFLASLDLLGSKSPQGE